MFHCKCIQLYSPVSEDWCAPSLLFDRTARRASWSSVGDCLRPLPSCFHPGLALADSSGSALPHGARSYAGLRRPCRGGDTGFELVAIFLAPLNVIAIRVVLEVRVLFLSLHL